MATARLRKWEQVYSVSYTLGNLEQSNVSDMQMFQLPCYLRRLKTVSSTFQDLHFDGPFYPLGIS